MADTSIEWSDKVWNPIGGCLKVSAGCKNCYAIDTAYNLVNRFKNAKKPNAGAIKYAGLTKVLTNGEKNWTGEVRFYENELIKPLKWKKPQRIFVNSMSDMFHEDVKIEWIAKIFAVMHLANQHTYQILTKRPERMREVLSSEEFVNMVCYAIDMFQIFLLARKNPNDPVFEKLGVDTPEFQNYLRNKSFEDVSQIITNNLKLEVLPSSVTGMYEYLPSTIKAQYPFKNVWLGVSVENQKAADERIPVLLGTPAAIRFLSMEPLLGEVDLTNMAHDYFDGIYKKGECTLKPSYNMLNHIDWVIVGGESGKGAREMKIEWAYKIIDACIDNNVPVFLKQMGSVLAKNMKMKDKKGGDIAEFPGHWRVRMYPELKGENK